MTPMGRFCTASAARRDRFSELLGQDGAWDGLSAGVAPALLQDAGEEPHPHLVVERWRPRPVEWQRVIHLAQVVPGCLPI